MSSGIEARSGGSRCRHRLRVAGYGIRIGLGLRGNIVVSIGAQSEVSEQHGIGWVKQRVFDMVGGLRSCLGRRKGLLHGVCCW